MTLDERLIAAGKAFKEFPAITVDEETSSYERIFASATTIAGALQRAGVRPGDLVALYSDRTYFAYASILGILLSGCGYVPLNPVFPVDRNRLILDVSGAKTLIVHCEVTEETASRLSFVPDAVTLLTPSIIEQISRSDGPANDLESFSCGALTGDSVCYILFTSGTTDVPKGVPISASNIEAYVDAVHRILPFNATDRVLQTADLTFDLSVHDMLMSWLHGAHLIVSPENGAMLAPRLIKKYGVTACLLVPSMAAKSVELGLVRRACMPSLKYSLFAGEALPVSLSRLWQEAAPEAKMYNLYGPTETTIHTSYFPVDPQNEIEWAVIPIGWPIGEQRLSIRDQEGRVVTEGETGEIWVSGPQVMKGYWRAPELAQAKLVNEEGTVLYRTGDLGRSHPRCGTIFAGRVDRQIKLRGYRVELQDVETALRKAAATEQVAVVALNLTSEGTAEDLRAYVAGTVKDAGSIRRELSRLLPHYMIPGTIELWADLPLNANGKINYRILHDVAEKVP